MARQAQTKKPKAPLGVRVRGINNEHIDVFAVALFSAI